MFTPSIISIAFSLSIIIFFISLTYPIRKLVYQSEKLNHSIEGLRGIACILVFVNHSAWMLTNNHIDSVKLIIQTSITLGILVHLELSYFSA